VIKVAGADERVRIQGEKQRAFWHSVRFGSSSWNDTHMLRTAYMTVDVLIFVMVASFGLQKLQIKGLAATSHQGLLPSI
jgi:hypothetical protein